LIINFIYIERDNMKNKSVSRIFVTGFQRSGTTLLRRLIQFHPEIRKMAHEATILANEDRFKKYTIDKNMTDNNSWGEKVPFYTSNIKRGFNKSIVEYCKSWNNKFKEKSKIIHILRHPYDVSISNQNKYKGLKIEKTLKLYSKIMPKIITDIYNLGNCYIIKYEDLLFNPEIELYNIFSFCEIDNSAESINKVINSYSEEVSKFEGNINKKRAFNYKRSEINFNYKFDKNFIHQLNSFGNTNYEF